MANFEGMIRENIESMNKLDGFNVVIVCCSSQLQAQYWQDRLENGRGSVLSENAVVLAVEEDWPGGAGNALGTLYAYLKASRLAKEKLGLDIDSQLKASAISIGLYHTAGKGTRMAPLPGAENNNKPGVKLPGTILLKNKMTPITILEAVIKQTGCYARSRAGRLSVFWGDQVFIPTVPVDYQVSHHIDILCSLGPMISEEEWQARGMEKYGLIAQSSSGSAAQVEKVTHATAVQLLSSLGEIQSVGASLGSFSISAAMLFLLLDEFSAELASKTGKLDSDPHLWMPMTLSKDSYLHLMAQKGVQAEAAGSHFDRIEAMMSSFHAKVDNAVLGLFGPVNVGQDVLWWDYGQLKLFQQNTKLMSETSSESELMRLFFGLSDSLVKDSVVSSCTEIDAQSCVCSSHIGPREGQPAAAEGASFVRNSVLSNVRCRHIQAEGAVLINVTADSIVAGPGSVVYNVVCPGALHVLDKEVRAGVFQSDGTQTVMHSHMDIDGGKAWEVKLERNPHSFDEIHVINAQVCPIALEGVIADAHRAAWEALHATTTTSTTAAVDTNACQQEL